MYYIYLAISVFILLYFYFTRNNDHWKNKNVPFFKPLLFFGNIIDGITLRHSFGEMFKELHQRSSDPVTGFFVFDQPSLLLRDHDIIKRVLISDFHNFFDRSVLNNKRDDPIGTHILFILKNPEWKEIRTKITPVFTSSKMKLMSKLIEDAANEMTNYLETKIQNSFSTEMKEICVRYTVDVITSCAFGVQANSFKKNNPQFLAEAKRLVNWDDFLTSFRMRCYFLGHIIVKIFRMKLFNPASIKFLEQNFCEIMDQRALSNNSHRKDLIDILLQMKNSGENFLDGDLLTSQAVVFFAAGFETSSSTMGFALHELTQHPKIQAKLRQEINEISDKYGGITYDSLKDMVYLDMCVKEVLRKYPVMPVLDRKTNKTYTIPETGTVVEKDTSVFISILGLHYDPKYFSNPELFDPERFSEENKHLIKNCSYLPFGEGPRNCIGARFAIMTVKLGLANLIKKFVLESCAETEKKIKFNKNALVLSALKGVCLKVTKT